MPSKRAAAEDAFRALVARLPERLDTGALASGLPARPVSAEATNAARHLVASLPGAPDRAAVRVARLAQKLERLRQLATAERDERDAVGR